MISTSPNIPVEENKAQYLSRTLGQWLGDFIEVETPSKADSFMEILPCFGKSLYNVI